MAQPDSESDLLVSQTASRTRCKVQLFTVEGEKVTLQETPATKAVRVLLEEASQHDPARWPELQIVRRSPDACVCVVVGSDRPGGQVLRAPVQVIDGNYQRMDGVCPWWDAMKGGSRLGRVAEGA